MRRRLGLHAVVGVSLACLAALLTGAAMAAPTDHPRRSEETAKRGERAITALGTGIRAVARSYGMTSRELKSRLRRDHDLAVDARGRLFFTCSRTSSQAAPLPMTAISPSALAPLADTFVLHSRPGADHILYLDFDGGMLSGTAWNAYTGVPSIICPAWSTDGNTAVFGDAERTAIQQIWQRVAEDYVPFDVDVTTQAPSADRITRSSTSDNVYGTRVLISPISSYFGSYGGIAYVGVYNHVDSADYYKPALVFPEKLGNGEKYIAEAASHEAGHNLGLSHDGTTTGAAYYQGQGSGETGWAPIMGLGYYRNLTQWSKGEYANANNVEDDLSVIQNHGLSLSADDCGGTTAAAVALPEGTALLGGGVIATAADVDFYSFTAGAGLATINVVPAERGPNLDIQADILDASGAVVATSTPIGFLASTLSPVLPAAGVYYLRVQGIGEGSALVTGYSDYASLGRYTISGTVAGPGSGPRPRWLPRSRRQ